MELLESLSFFVNNPQLLCLILLSGLLFKSYLLSILLTKYSSKPESNIYGIFLLCIILFSASMADLYWILTIFKRLSIIQISSPTYHFLSRIIDALNTTLHLSISLLIGILLHKKINEYQAFKIMRVFMGTLLITFFVITAFLDKNETFPYVLIGLRTLYFYILVIGSQSVYQSMKAIDSHKIPNLLKHQLKIFIYAM